MRRKINSFYILAESFGKLKRWTIRMANCESQMAVAMLMVLLFIVFVRFCRFCWFFAMYFIYFRVFKVFVLGNIASGSALSIQKKNSIFQNSVIDSVILASSSAIKEQQQMEKQNYSHSLFESMRCVLLLWFRSIEWHSNYGEFHYVIEFFPFSFFGWHFVSFNFWFLLHSFDNKFSTRIQHLCFIFVFGPLSSLFLFRWIRISVRLSFCFNLLFFKLKREKTF